MGKNRRGVPRGMGGALEAGTVGVEDEGSPRGWEEPRMKGKREFLPLGAPPLSLWGKIDWLGGVPSGMLEDHSQLVLGMWNRHMRVQQELPKTS